MKHPSSRLPPSCGWLFLGMEGLLGRDAWLAQRVIQLRISRWLRAGSGESLNVNENYSYYSVGLRDMQGRGAALLQPA
ncbi:hypothetical protein ACPJXG_05110 [Janthinobacterium sp. NFX145]|uniref:hypothetical protein n=1 Tax=Janthinobacterium sp. NFX145 TaxID=3415602 RepID=UPI003CC5D200